MVKLNSFRILFIFSTLLLLFLIVTCGVQKASNGDNGNDNHEEKSIFYVSPNGDDNNPGTRELPWKSPAVAVSRLKPGDTLILLPGIYVLSDYENDIIRPPSGKSDAWITIKGEENEPYPVLAGKDNLMTAMELGGVQYLKIKHIEITHYASANDIRFREGINVTNAPASHLVFDDIYIHHVDEFGMDIQDVYDLTIRNSRITYAGFGALGGPSGNYGGWREVRIEDTELSYGGHYYQGGDGSNRPYDRPDGFGIEVSDGPITLERMKVEHNYGDGIDSKARITIVRDSLIANNSCDGLKLWGEEGTVENVLIYGRGDGDPTVTPWAAIVIDTQIPNANFYFNHITVDDELGQNYLLYVQYDHPQIPVNLRWRNMILSSRGSNAPIYLAQNVNLNAKAVLFYFPQDERIIVYGNDEYNCRELNQLGENLFCGDPKFRQTGWGNTGDYHLESDSPAIDAGIQTGLDHDLDGYPRDSKPDLGVYEYRSKSSKR